MRRRATETAGLDGGTKDQARARSAAAEGMWEVCHFLTLVRLEIDARST